MKLFALLFFMSACTTYPRISIPDGKYANSVYRENRITAVVVDKNLNPVEFKHDTIPVIDEWVSSSVGRVFFTAYDGKWYLNQFNDDLTGVDEVGAVDYKWVWGNPLAPGWLAGIKDDGNGTFSLDVISALDGEIRFSYKNVHPQASLYPLGDAFAVRFADNTYRLLIAKERQNVGGNFYTKTLEEVPHRYIFANQLKYLYVAVREDSVVQIIHQGKIFQAPVQAPAPVQRWSKEFYLFPDQINFKKLVLLRDGQPTPAEYSYLDEPQMRKAITMKYETGIPVGWAVQIGEGNEARYHFIRIAHDLRSSSRSDKMYLEPGTILIHPTAVRDVRGASTFDPVRFKFQEAALVLCETGWNGFNFFQHSEEEDVGATAPYCGNLATDKDAYEEYKNRTPVGKMTIQEIAQRRQEVFTREQAMLKAASDDYNAKVKADEYKRKLSEWEAEEQSRREISNSLQGISNSLTQGATSNTPSGPKGFEDKYDNTGAGYNRYDKAIKERARKKAACTGAGCY